MVHIHKLKTPPTRIPRWRGTWYLGRTDALEPHWRCQKCWCTRRSWGRNLFFFWQVTSCLNSIFAPENWWLEDYIHFLLVLAYFQVLYQFWGVYFFPPNIHKPYFFHGFLDLKKPISVLQPTKLTTNTESFPWKIAGKGRRRLLGITWNNFFHEDRLPRTFRIPFGKWSSKPGNEFLFWELDNENGFQVPFSSARLPQFKQSPNRACSVTGGMYRGVPSWGWMITPFP